MASLADEIVALGQAGNLESKTETSTPGNWSEKDTVVITYADTFLDPPEMPLTTLKNFLVQHLEGLVSSVHILPFFPYSSDDGFSVEDYRAVNPAWGNWGIVRQISKRFRLMADLVVNHCSANSKWFENFIKSSGSGSDYFYTYEGDKGCLDLVTRPRTNELLRIVETKDGKKSVWCTFSHDQVDLDFSNPEVLKEFISIIHFYFSQGIRTIRLDAIAFLWKEPGTNCINLPQTHEIVKLIREVLEHYYDDATIITETNIPSEQNISYFGEGDEAHMVYNFPLPPLLANTLLVGDSGTFQSWLASQPSLGKGCYFFNFIASHDGLGLRPAEGLLSKEEVDNLVKLTYARGGEVSFRALGGGDKSPYELNISLFNLLAGSAATEGRDSFAIDRFLCAHTVMLALKGVPAFYVQSLLGTPNARRKFNRLGYNRALNRRNWHLYELKKELENENSQTSLVFNSIKRLIATRKQEPAFHPEAIQTLMPEGWSASSACESKVIAFVRELECSGREGESKVLCLSNISLESLEFNLEKTGFSDCLDLLSGQKLKKSATLPPYQSLWLKPLS